jgi:tRNA-splicing ligase RtcB (3'-phosphate/5'-hydroxy nucleic acid ligase)
MPNPNNQSHCITTMSFQYIATDNVPIKAWVNGVPIEDQAVRQLRNLASLPFMHRHVAAMPDVHWGMGATIGSVIATKGAIIPAAVGVDIGCGMCAMRTTLTASDLPDDLGPLRSAIEAAIPHGRSNDGGAGDVGAHRELPPSVISAVSLLQPRLSDIVQKHPPIGKAANRAAIHAGTLGGGNHFVEVCIDEEQRVWVMLHSGSRGIGNRIGTYFIERARKEMERHFIQLPDRDLAYLVEGSDLFDDYVEAVGWAQDYARLNRDLMMAAALQVLSQAVPKPMACDCEAVNCHHNYVKRERHFGADVMLTRKGAVSAQEGELGIIPGSMGAKSFIVAGKGNRESFCSCSHGAGRLMGRKEAKRRFTIEDHIAATARVECRKDDGVIDETPGAYKSIDAVMAAQQDLVEIRHTLRQVLCVKG